MMSLHKPEDTWDRLMTSVPVNRAALIITLGGEGSDDLTPEVEIENLQKAIRNLMERIKAVPKGSEERREMGLQQKAMENRLKELRVLLPPKKSKPREYASIWMDVAKEYLTRPMFEIISKEAKRRAGIFGP